MLYSANNRKSGHGTSRRGASLIEVLVALVLLVVGIYSIARLFPGGFFSLRSAQNSDVADRLAQGQLEQRKQDNNFLLDAVYMYSNEVGFFSDNPNVSPTAAGTYTPPGGATADATLADINKARYISGETFTVPAPNTSTADAATNGVSIRVLNDGPVAVTPASGGNPAKLAEPPRPAVSPLPVAVSPVGVYGLPPVHSGPWVAKTGNAPQGFNDPNSPNYNAGYDAAGSFDQPTDLLTAGQPNYAIDYANQEIALSAQSYTQYFTLVLKVNSQKNSSSTPNPNPVTTATYYIPLAIPSSYTGTWFNPTTSYQDTGRSLIVDASTAAPLNQAMPIGSTSGYQYTWTSQTAVLTRTLTQAQDVPTLKQTYTNPAADPYTYALYEPGASGSNLTNLTGVNLGVLAFNPRLQGQAVSVSYLTYDWHIIREDQDIPSYTPGVTPQGQLSPIHLTIDHLKRVGDVQDDQTINPGLFRSGDFTGTGYDIVVLDTDTGQSIGLSAPPAATITGDVYDLDNQNGPPDTSNGNTGPDPGSFLVSYQNGYITLPNSTDYPLTQPWASVAHQHVRIFYAGDYNWAVALQKNPSLYTQGSNGVLLPGQYGISVTGNVVHLHFPVSDQGQTVNVSNITYVDTSGNTQRILDVTGSTITTDYSDANYVSLGTLPTAIGTNNVVTIGAVQGISARSVVVWKERGQWKSRSVSTILNPS